ncbi:hypothetical protein A5641_28405 [Mycobacterium sp. 1554424.7]|nr:hypothetical protein A5641_28405 [Mycobacterium sp. 1554424.7]
MHPRHVTVGPHVVDERLHDRPQQRRRLTRPERPGRAGRRDVGRFGWRLQDTVTAAKVRCGFGIRIIRRALLNFGAALPASVDRGGRGLQQLLGRVLIPEAEHLAGRVMAGVGRKTRRQHRQIGGQTVSGGGHGAAHGEQRLRIDDQGHHAPNSR